MKIRSLILLLCAVYGAFLTFGFAQPSSNLAVADNKFAFDLYARLASQKGNIFFSPYSLSSALDMTYEGARGETAQQMLAVLHLDANDIERRTQAAALIQQINSPDKTYQLSVANALWAEKTYPFKDDYLNLVKSTYFAELRNMNFLTDPEGSRATINHWVADKTNDRIKDLLPRGSIESFTRLVLTNAVYFKDSWMFPFEKRNTKPDTFWLAPGKSVQADMMMLEDKSFNYTADRQAQILQLPYKGNDVSMLLILPRSKSIESLEKNINENRLQEWQDKMSSKVVKVLVPKFKFEATYQMKSVLSDMGMTRAFDATNADFSGMATFPPEKKLYIDEVYHKTWIDTNEEGTEAAAATAVVMMDLAEMPSSQTEVFRADHPFIFVIHENNTGHILFMGRVSDPREK